MTTSNSIVAIFGKELDPIGIADEPVAQNEYDEDARRSAAPIADGTRPCEPVAQIRARQGRLKR